MSTPTPLVDLSHAAESAPTFKVLMTAAETIFGSGSGAAKKKWVTEQLVALADKVNIPVIPPTLEHALKVAIIGALIELLWGVLFKGA